MRPTRPTRRARPASSVPDRQRYAIPGSDFKRLAIQNRMLYLRHDLIAQADTIMAAVIHPPSSTVEGELSTGAGNRNSGFPLKLANGTDLFIRFAHRGGLMRFLNRGLYLGVTPRPVHELAVTAEARRRGLSAVEPIGAVVQWLAPALYRGAFITRMLHGMTLWQFVQTDDDSAVRAHVIEEARRAINLTHQQGLFHADLNLHNLFVSTAGESFAIALLDLDKARLYALPLEPALRAKNFARLRRSISKLDPRGLYFNDAMVKTLTAS
jgi:3-deoxy-D-manno-octulosonic acid kinase